VSQTFQSFVASPTTSSSQVKRAVVTSSGRGAFINLRAEPKQQSAECGTVPVNSEVDVLESDVGEAKLFSRIQFAAQHGPALVLLTPLDSMQLSFYYWHFVLNFWLVCFSDWLRQVCLSTPH
jgi:hypothetical protein